MSKNKTSPVRDERKERKPCTPSSVRKMTFKDKVQMFLKKHGMEYVERDLE